MDKAIWSSAGRSYSTDNKTQAAYVELLNKTAWDPQYEAVSTTAPLAPGDEVLLADGTWRTIQVDEFIAVTSDKGIGASSKLIRRKKAKALVKNPNSGKVEKKAEQVATAEKIERNNKTMATTTPTESALSGIFTGAATTLGIDQGTKFVTRKLAKVLARNGKPEAARLLLTKEARDGLKFVAPAIALGVATVCADWDNPAIADAAKSAIPTLKMATAAGLATVGSSLIENFILNEEDEMEELLNIINAAERDKLEAGVDNPKARMGRKAAKEARETEEVGAATRKI